MGITQPTNDYPKDKRIDNAVKRLTIVEQEVLALKEAKISLSTEVRNLIRERRRLDEEIEEFKIKQKELSEKIDSSSKEALKLKEEQEILEKAVSDNKEKEADFNERFNKINEILCQ